MYWSSRWGMEFPFYYVQIAPYEDYNGLSSYLRESQRKALKLDKTSMVVTLDIGETNDIHPGVNLLIQVVKIGRASCRERV